MNYEMQPHIKLAQVDEFCILTGNPDRVPVIASHLTDAREVAAHRGLVAYKGKTEKKGVPVTILTSGMGAPSTSIVVEEAFRAGARIFFRIGSCGALQAGPEYGIASIYIPQGAIRDEGASRALVPLEFPAVAAPQLHLALSQAAESLEISYHHGIVLTSDIYYPPEEPLFKKWGKYGANCVDMETALMFSYQAVKHGMQAATILTADGNLADQTDIYSGDMDANVALFRDGMDNAIKIAIKAIDSLNHQ